MSETPRTTLPPRLTRGDPYTGTPKPNTRTSTSQSSFLNVNTTIADKPEPVFADRQSGVLFTSGLIRATGDRVTVQKFCKAHGLAPTLHLVIPPSSPPPPPSAAAVPTSSTTNEHPPLPSFALTLASPTTTGPPHSPIHHHPTGPRAFSRTSYDSEIMSAPRHMRVPYLPQYCIHTLRPYVPLTNCALCAIQLQACETWWYSRNPPKQQRQQQQQGLAAGLKRSSMRLLGVPQVLPADCTPTTRSIYYALGLPLGKLDESCIDWDVVDTILFIRSRLPRRHRNRELPAGSFRKEVPSSSPSRIRVLFRRARRFFNTL